MDDDFQYHSYQSQTQKALMMFNLAFQHRMMRRALHLADRARGFTAPNPVVGAVIVKNGKVIGEGWHHKAGGPHAEIEAIRSAGKRSLKGASLFVTLEPCCTTGRTPPCTEAIIRAGFSEVYAGCTDPNSRHAGRGFEVLRSAGIQVVTGVLESKCLAANEAFFHYITTKRPLVVLKMASTLDGKTAAASGDSKWITSERARRRVQELRRNSDAILVGSGTFLADSPSLTVRDRDGNVIRTPLRFVASSNGSPALPEGWERADLSSPEKWNCFLTELGCRGVMQLLIEGGGTLAASAIQAHAVDRIEFHYAPKILCGAHSHTICDGPDPMRLSDAVEISQIHLSHCGPDFIVTGVPVYKK